MTVKLHSPEGMFQPVPYHHVSVATGTRHVVNTTRVPDAHVSHPRVTLPAAIARRVVSVTRDFGLVFAAWDLIATRDHRILALELNPGGQWAFVPGHHHVTNALADHLEHTTR